MSVVARKQPMMYVYQDSCIKDSIPAQIKDFTAAKIKREYRNEMCAAALERYTLKDRPHRLVIHPKTISLMNKCRDTGFRFWKKECSSGPRQFLKLYYEANGVRILRTLCQANNYYKYFEYFSSSCVFANQETQNTKHEEQWSAYSNA